MITIPRPRDPLAPERRSTRAGVIWTAAKPDVTAAIVVRSIPQGIAQGRTAGTDRPRPRR